MGMGKISMMKLIICRGKSMLPTMKKLGIAFHKKISSYKIGDVVVFRGSNGKLFCHRIISLDYGEFTTKGDNEKTSHYYEKGMPESNIEGKIVWCFP